MRKCWKVARGIEQGRPDDANLLRPPPQDGIPAVQALPATKTNDLDLLMDVDLPVSIELGAPRWLFQEY
jgi:hypothetical protein